MSRVKCGDLRAYGGHVSGKRFVTAIEGCETKVSLTSSILFDQVGSLVFLILKSVAKDENEVILDY